LDAVEYERATDLLNAVVSRCTELAAAQPDEPRWPALRAEYAARRRASAANTNADLAAVLQEAAALLQQLPTPE
jgi:hypothetical protein